MEDRWRYNSIWKSVRGMALAPGRGNLGYATICGRKTIMADQKNNIHLVWGVALLLAGLGVFYRIPQVMPRLEEMAYFSSGTFFVRLCFYLIGGILIAGGSKKIYRHFREKRG